MITITGIPEVFRDIDDTIKHFEKNADKAFQNAGKRGRDEAKKRARVRTGNMKASIAYARGVMEASFVCPTWYSVFVEMGTRRSRAYPFMRPAFSIASKMLWEELQRL